MSICQLPEEIVLWIHFLAESPAFPLAHPTFYHSLHNTSKRYVARYLLDLHRSHDSLAFVHCLRHPICGIEVCDEIARIWAVRQPDRLLTCPTLPTRLFRLAERAVPPLLKYLFDKYSPSPNDPNGYPLSRSVLSHNDELIKYLLDKGAHPGVRGGLAVRTAVQIKRLDLVKLLVEPAPLVKEISSRGEGKDAEGKRDDKEDPMGLSTTAHPPRAAAIGVPSASSSLSSPSRPPREDRYKVGSELVELAMKAGADDIVNYFIRDKGVMPPLRSIMSMGKKKEDRLGKRKRLDSGR